jgi:hypothetical protein
MWRSPGRRSTAGRFEFEVLERGRAVDIWLLFLTVDN